MSAIANTTTKLVKKARAKIAALYLVITDGKEIGLLEKYKNTKTETHPWKAFLGVGENAQYLGAIYGPAGKQRATNWILQEAGLIEK